MKLLVVLFTLSFYSLADDCLKTKVAFDIGSGATKMKVAKVDVCVQKIKEILLDTSLPVEYKDDVQNSEDNKFSKAIQEKGIEAIKKLKTMASKYSPVSHGGVATSAFRTAANGEELAAKIENLTGVEVKIIDQDEEARIGFVGATQVANSSIKDIVVWDIGGGSMQITTYGINGKFQIYRGKVASASFKKHIIEEIQGANPKQILSPNPIEVDELEVAERDARVVSALTVPDEIKQKIKQGSEIIGIGGVHYHSVKGQTKVKDFYTGLDIERALESGLGKDDKQIGGNYASSEISNLILVKGFMEGLGVDKVYPAKINLADGVLLMSDED